MKRDWVLPRAFAASSVVGVLAVAVGLALGNLLVAIGGSALIVLALGGWQIWTLRRLLHQVATIGKRQHKAEAALKAIRVKLSQEADQLAAVDRRIDGLRDAMVAAKGVEQQLVTSTRGLTNAMAKLPSELLTEQQAMDQLLAEFSPKAPLPLVAGWAMAPVGLRWLVYLVEQTRPELVVECGSGTTSLWIALALKKAGRGRLVCLEHSATYAEKTTEWLRLHEVTEQAEVLLTPLTEVSTARGSFQWYDIDPAKLGEVDLLVVDGPPGGTGPHARYPALPVFAPYLKAGAVIIADDLHRKDEREILEFWTDEHQQLQPYADISAEVKALIWSTKAAAGSLDD